MGDHETPFTPVFVACLFAVIFTLASDSFIIMGYGHGDLPVMVLDAFERAFGKICNFLCFLSGGVLLLRLLRDKGLLKDVDVQVFMVFEYLAMLGVVGLSWKELRSALSDIMIIYRDLVMNEIDRFKRK